MRRLLSGELLQRPRGRRIAYLLLLIAPALFSSNMLLARATADFIPPVALAFWRWTLTLLLLLPLAGAGLWRQRWAAAREWRDLLVLGALGMGVCGAFVYIGADTTPATNIGLIYAASPVLILLLAWGFHGERLSPRQLLGVGLGLAGVVTLISHGDPRVLAELAFTPGDLWIFAAASGWAVYSILLRYRPSRLDTLTRFTAICLGGVLVLAPFHLWEAAIAGEVPALDAPTLAAMGALALFAGFGAYQCYGLVQQALGAARTGVIIYLAPLYTAVLAMLLLGEELRLYHAVGALLVLPGVLLATWAPGKGGGETAGDRAVEGREA